MSGEMDLAKLLVAMEPVLDKQPFGYATVSNEKSMADIKDVFAFIREIEGLTIIAPITVLEQHAIPYEGRWAKISLTIHSALSAVGLTAAVAKALTEQNISANVVAGFYHDHFFVQWDRRMDALAALHKFKT